MTQEGNVSFTRQAFGIALIFSAAAQAADPPARPATDKPAPRPQPPPRVPRSNCRSATYAST